jgi:hypothetical protein
MLYEIRERFAAHVSRKEMLLKHRACLTDLLNQNRADTLIAIDNELTNTNNELNALYKLLADLEPDYQKAVGLPRRTREATMITHYNNKEVKLELSGNLDSGYLFITVFDKDGDQTAIPLTDDEELENLFRVLAMMDKAGSL